MTPQPDDNRSTLRNQPEEQPLQHDSLDTPCNVPPLGCAAGLRLDQTFPSRAAVAKVCCDELCALFQVYELPIGPEGIQHILDVLWSDRLALAFNPAIVAAERIAGYPVEVNRISEYSAGEGRFSAESIFSITTPGNAGRYPFLGLELRRDPESNSQERGVRLSLVWSLQEASESGYTQMGWEALSECLEVFKLPALGESFRSDLCVVNEEAGTFVTMLDARLILGAMLYEEVDVSAVESAELSSLPVCQHALVLVPEVGFCQVTPRALQFSLERLESPLFADLVNRGFISHLAEVVSGVIPSLKVDLLWELYDLESSITVRAISGGLLGDSEYEPGGVFEAEADLDEEDDDDQPANVLQSVDAADMPDSWICQPLNTFEIEGMSYHGMDLWCSLQLFESIVEPAPYSKPAQTAIRFGLASPAESAVDLYEEVWKLAHSFADLRGCGERLAEMHEAFRRTPIEFGIRVPRVIDDLLFGIVCYEIESEALPDPDAEDHPAE